MRLAVIAAIIGIALASPAHAARRIAVLVSNNSADPSRESLRYAERDAREMQRVLSTLGGVRTTYVLSEDTPDALRATWKQVERDATSSEEPVMLFFFYSGHADDRGLLMGEARYEFTELRTSLEKLPVQLFVAIVDACRSGALARLKGGSAVPVLDVDFAESSPTQAGGVFITSAAYGESAQESDELGGSFFTHALVSALRGAADDSGDRRVSLEEAYRFAYAHTLHRTRGTMFGPQHATFDVDIEGEGQLVLTWLNPERSYVVLPEDASGRWIVRNLSSATMFAEFEKPRGKRMRIAVEPGSYEVSRVERAQEWTLAVNVARAGEIEIRTADLRARPLSQGSRKGATDDLADRVQLGYRISGGYLDDMKLSHGVRARYALDFAPFEVGAFAGYGLSRYTRSDAIAVGVSELSLGAAALIRSELDRRWTLLAGIDVALAHVTQNGELSDAGSETRRDIVFPLAIRGGSELTIVPRVALRVLGGFGGTLVRAPDGVRFPLQLSAELGVSWSP